MGKSRALTALAVATSIAFTASPAYSSVAGTTRSVIPHGASTQREAITPVAGSASTLLYLLTPTSTRGLGYQSERDVYVPAGPARLFARSRSGAVSAVPSSCFGNGAGWSTVGSVIVGANRKPGGATQLGVWETKSGRCRHYRLPKGDRFLTAVPGGFAYSTPSTTIKIRTANGRTRVLGNAFHQQVPLIYASSDAHHLVVSTTGGRARVLAYSRPGHFTALRTGTKDLLDCMAVNSRYAACNGAVPDDGTDFGYDWRTAELVSLDGSAPTIYSSEPGNGVSFGVALSGHTMIWQDFNEDDWPAVQLASLSAGSSQPDIGTTKTLAGNLVTAYARAITVNPTSSHLLSAQTADHAALVQTAPRSPVTASVFTVAPGGRLVDVDDRPVPKHPGTADTVWSEQLRIRHGRVVASAPRPIRVDPPTGGMVIDTAHVAASASTTAYAMSKPFSAGGPFDDTAKIVASSPAGTTNIAGTVRSAPFTLSGSRLLYQLANTAGGTFHVRDLATGVDKAITATPFDRPDSVALSGKYIVYVDKHGAVYREDLTNDTLARVTKPLAAGEKATDADVFADGDHVVWRIYATSSTGRPISFSGMRDARTLSRIVTLGRRTRIVRLTDVGAEVETGKHPNVVQLVGFSGHARRLLSARTYIGRPRILGNILAWINENGRIEARPM